MCYGPRETFKFSHLPVGDRFEEPLANLLNEQHRTVKELLEQLKMKKSSARQQQEVERVKLQSEKVQQTLILDPGQRRRLQQQMQQVRLFWSWEYWIVPWPDTEAKKVTNRCLYTHWNHRTTESSHCWDLETSAMFVSIRLRQESTYGPWQYSELPVKESLVILSEFNILTPRVVFSSS